MPYTTTPLERDLALALGIPMYGADPRLAHCGTKSGCRELFADVGVAHPLGVEHIYSVPDGDRRDRRPARRASRRSQQVVMKLNEGVSGEGNAIVDLRRPPGARRPGEAPRSAERVAAMAFEAPEPSRLERYLGRLAAHGGIVEERIVGAEVRSPSVQLRVTPAGEVEMLSTHDQLLGGASGQSYLGCRFPADPAYARRSPREAAEGRTRLAAAGRARAIRGRLRRRARRDGGGWDAYAIELNLRKGGTTHPFAALQFLTGRRLRPGHGDLHGAGRAARSTSSRPTTSRRRPCGRWDAAARCPRSPARACTSTTSARPAS